MEVIKKLNMKIILLFPGAFTPPHLGHVDTRKIALEQFFFDEVGFFLQGNVMTRLSQQNMIKHAN